jgi:protein SCO1/2
MSRPLRLGLAAVALLALIAGAVLMLGREPARAEALRAGEYDPPRPAPEFTLAGSDGSEVTLAEHRGKVVLLTFGFTYCAAVCPTTLATLAQARSRLGDKADAVQVIFVTVDPDRDDAAQMSRYLAAFDPSFIGATGEPAALAAVREAYGVTAVKEGTGPDYAMAHTSSIFLIDRAGRLRAMMPFGRDAADFAHDIEILLDAQA